MMMLLLLLRWLWKSKHARQAPQCTGRTVDLRQDLDIDPRRRFVSHRVPMLSSLLLRLVLFHLLRQYLDKLVPLHRRIRPRIDNGGTPQNFAKFLNFRNRQGPFVQQIQQPMLTPHFATPVQGQGVIEPLVVPHHFLGLPRLIVQNFQTQFQQAIERIVKIGHGVIVGTQSDHHPDGQVFHQFERLHKFVLDLRRFVARFVGR
mmetsp:Transcript_9893/g.27453  ORF Transcript_9893/g.27453 Transcript_9893/m.27453 type:complete len:203 (+) Transcript_9893:203-811(+)